MLRFVDSSSNGDCVQDCILASLSAQHPGLAVVGEEGEVDPARVDAAMVVRAADPAALQLPCPEQWRGAGLADLTVWVDPLDGTKEYTQVGLSLQGNQGIWVEHSGEKPTNMGTENFDPKEGFDD